MAVNWLNVNMPTILTVLTVGAGTVTYINKLEARISASEDYRVMRSAQTDKAFADVGAQLHLMQDLPYRMGQVESNVGNSNTRIDRIADSVLSSVEGLKKDVGTLSTQTQLIGQKQDILSSKVDSLDVPRSHKMFTPFYPGEYIPYPRLRTAFSEGPLVPLR